MSNFAKSSFMPPANAFIKAIPGAPIKSIVKNIVEKTISTDNKIRERFNQTPSPPEPNVPFTATAVAQNITLTPEELEFSEDGMVKNLNLYTERSEGMIYTLTGFEAGMFVTNSYGKSRAKVLLSQSDMSELTRVHGIVSDLLATKTKFPVGLRSPGTNKYCPGGIEVGFPMRTEKGQKVHKDIVIYSKDSLEYGSLNRVNELMHTLSPTAITGKFNVWAKGAVTEDGEEYLDGGYYFIVEAITF